jgi:hypothetical protein
MSAAAEPCPTELTTGELTTLFERGEMPDVDFTHRDHVRVAWELLGRYSLATALDRMTSGVQTLARQRGVPGLYHETITTFYMLAVADARSQLPTDERFSSFAEQHPALLGNSSDFLIGFYRPETLDSVRARQSFVVPERIPSPD